MIKVPVKVYSESRHPLPSYARLFDSGMDAIANLPVKDSSIFLNSREKQLIPTGLFVAIPPGYEIQVRPRSGTSLKTDLRVSNTPGTIDSPYRGEICIIAENIGVDPLEIKDGAKIAQLVLAPVVECVWEPVESKEALGTTDRGIGGFGHSG